MQCVQRKIREAVARIKETEPANAPRTTRMLREKQRELMAIQFRIETMERDADRRRALTLVQFGLPRCFLGVRLSADDLRQVTFFVLVSASIIAAALCVAHWLSSGDASVRLLTVWD